MSEEECSLYEESDVDQFGLEQIRVPEIDPAKPTMILLTGASGVGKDSIIDGCANCVDGEGRIIGEDSASITRVITTTSREPRDGETDQDYNFVEFKPLAGEEDTELEARAMDQLGLVECSAHMGAVYGVPEGGIEVIRELGMGMIRMEIFGAKNIKPILETLGFNVCVVAVQPSEDVGTAVAVLRNRILGRGDMSKQDLERRLERARSEMEEERRFADFVIQNETGQLERSKRAFETLVARIKSCQVNVPEI